MRLYFESIAVVGAQPKPSVPTHKFESNKKGENGGTPTRKLDNFSRLPRRSPSVVFDQARFKAYTKKGVFWVFPENSLTCLISKKKLHCTDMLEWIQGNNRKYIIQNKTR